MSPKKSSPIPSTSFTVITGSAKAPQTRRFRMKRRHVVRAITGIVALGALLFFGYDPAYPGSLVIRAPRPLVFADRGVSDREPDNSLHAVQRAFDVNLDGVQLHGKLTRDGQLIIGSDSGREVYTLEDVVRAVRRRGTLLIELEAPDLGSTGIEQRAVQVIRKYDAHLSVVVGSFNPLLLYRVKRLDPFVRTAFISTDEVNRGGLANFQWLLRQEVIRRVVRKTVRPDVLSISEQTDDAVINRLIAKGWPVMLWTPNDDPSLRRALSKNPYGVISDQPMRAMELR
jgi:glycerophosphoryl diester phosphodiesterase